MKKTTDEIVPKEVAEPNDEPTMKQLMALLLESRAADQDIQRQQLKQTRRMSNARGPDVSVFNPQGQKDFPMPPLAFDVLAPWPMPKGQYHPLTVEEVMLMNRVTPGEVVLDLMDDTTVPCSIIATKNATNGKIEKIAFMGARDADTNGYVTLFSKERRSQFPSMVRILHQVLDQQGTDYSDILTMGQINKRIALPEGNPERLLVSVGE